MCIYKGMYPFFTKLPSRLPQWIHVKRMLKGNSLYTCTLSEGSRNILPDLMKNIVKLYDESDCEYVEAKLNLKVILYFLTLLMKAPGS